MLLKEMQKIHRFNLAAIAATALLLTLSLYMHFTTGFWGDKEWVLNCARMMMGGKKLYTDIIELNPPLIFYLYELPVYLSGQIGLMHDYQWLVLLGVCSIAASITLSTRLIAAHPAFAGNGGKQIQFITLLCFVFIFQTPPFYFFDREHMFLVLSFPYVLRLMPSLFGQPVSRGERIIIGCMAGIAFCIKPHFLIIFIGLQILCFFRGKVSFVLCSLENIIIYCIGAMYLFGMAWFFPEYFSTIIPIMMDTYSAYSTAETGGMDKAALFITFLTLVMFRLRRTSPYRRDIYYFALLCVFFLLYALINNGWGYTYHPLFTYLLITTGFVLWEFIYLRQDSLSHQMPSWQCTLGIAACVLNFAVKVIFGTLYYFTFLLHGCHGYDSCSNYEYYLPFMKELRLSNPPFVPEGMSHAYGHYRPFTKDMEEPAPPLHSFGTISMDGDLWSHITKISGAEWQTRFPILWMFPKFIIADADFRKTHQWILYYMANGLTEDLNTNKPDIMFVDIPDTFHDIQQPVDFITFFSVFENFRDAWSHYTYVHTIDMCDERRFLPLPNTEMRRKPQKNRINCRYNVFRRAF